MNIMHELLQGILKDRMSPPVQPLTNSVSHDILICRENREQRENSSSQGMCSAFPQWFMYSEKNVLVKTIIIIPTVATLDPSDLYSDFKFLRRFRI